MPPRFKLEWYVDAEGDAPVCRWLAEELVDAARELIGAATLEVLQADRPGVCGTRFGRQPGGGIFEFRLDGDGLTQLAAAKLASIAQEDLSRYERAQRESGVPDARETGQRLRRTQRLVRHCRAEGCESEATSWSERQRPPDAQDSCSPPLGMRLAT